MKVASAAVIVVTGKEGSLAESKPSTLSSTSSDKTLLMLNYAYFKLAFDMVSTLSLTIICKGCLGCRRLLLTGYTFSMLPATFDKQDCFCILFATFSCKNFCMCASSNRFLRDKAGDEHEWEVVCFSRYACSLVHVPLAAARSPLHCCMVGFNSKNK